MNLSAASVPVTSVPAVQQEDLHLDEIQMNLSAASVPVTSVPAVQQEALHLDEVQMNLSAASVTKSVFPVTVILPDISEIIEIALSEKRG